MAGSWTEKPPADPSEMRVGASEFNLTSECFPWVATQDPTRTYPRRPARPATVLCASLGGQIASLAAFLGQYVRAGDQVIEAVAVDIPGRGDGNAAVVKGSIIGRRGK